VVVGTATVELEVVVIGVTEVVVGTVEVEVELGFTEVDGIGSPPHGLPWPHAKQLLVQFSWKSSMTVLSWFWILCVTPAALYASSQPVGPYTLFVHPADGTPCATLAGVSLSPNTSVHILIPSPWFT
jgi:hypothetical protein